MLRRTACCSKWQLAIRPCISTDDLGLAYDEIATWVLALVIRKGVHGLVQEDSLSEEGDMQSVTMLAAAKPVPSFSDELFLVVMMHAIVKKMSLLHFAMNSSQPLCQLPCYATILASTVSSSRRQGKLGGNS